MALYERRPKPGESDNPPFNGAGTSLGRSGGSGAIVWAVIALLIAVVVLWALFSFIF